MSSISFQCLFPVTYFPVPASELGCGLASLANRGLLISEPMPTGEQVISALRSHMYRHLLFLSPHPFNFLSKTEPQLSASPVTLLPRRLVLQGSPTREFWGQCCPSCLLYGEHSASDCPDVRPGDLRSGHLAWGWHRLYPSNNLSPLPKYWNLQRAHLHSGTTCA